MFPADPSCCTIRSEDNSSTFSAQLDEKNQRSPMEWLEDTEIKKTDYFNLARIRGCIDFAHFSAKNPQAKYLILFSVVCPAAIEVLKYAGRIRESLKDEPISTLP